MLDREDYAAICAIQNIMLAAWEDGIGMQWSTSGLIEDAEALSVLGVDPEREQVSACCTRASRIGCRLDAEAGCRAHHLAGMKWTRR